MIFDMLFKRNKSQAKTGSSKYSAAELAEAEFNLEVTEALRRFMDTGSTTYPIARLWKTEETTKSVFYDLINKYIRLKRGGLSSPDDRRALENLYTCFEAVAKSMPAGKGKFDTYYYQFCSNQPNLNFGNFGGELLYNLSRAGRL